MSFDAMFIEKVANYSNVKEVFCFLIYSLTRPKVYRFGLRDKQKGKKKQ